MLISVAQPYYPSRFKITKQKLPKASSLLTMSLLNKFLKIAIWNIFEKQCSIIVTLEKGKKFLLEANYKTFHTSVKIGVTHIVQGCRAWKYSSQKLL